MKKLSQNFNIPPQYFEHFLSNREKYLPYLYPLVMPIFLRFASPIPIYLFQDVVRFWLFTGFLQFILLVLIQKTLYLTTYKQLIKWLLASIIGIIAVFTYYFLEYNVFHFTARFTNPNKWIPVVRNIVQIPIIIALLETIKSAAERKRILIDNIALENENAKAQLNLLLQQINPHFLFNCFTVLQAMVRSKDTRTEAFIIKLGEVFHQTLKTEKDRVTLKEELDFFNAYMYLMSLRHEKAIFVDVKVSDESLGYQLPAYSLQLLAENCIKHNIVSEAKPLYIRLYQKGPKTLTLSNNYQPKALKSESFNIGIQNLKKRYALEGIVQGVQIEQNETNYSTTIKLF
jgi:two-component system, LytTR family, sensor kinase